MSLIRPYGPKKFLTGEVEIYNAKIKSILYKVKQPTLALVSFVFRDKILKHIHTLKC